jgi:hypothetical protein
MIIVMVVLYMFAGMIGAVITAWIFWPYGLGIALVIAPFGGSFLAVATAGLVMAWTMEDAPAHESRRAEPFRTPALRQP